MINDLNHNTSAWCDWNLFLDETGGPNHVNNLCSAPIIADTVNDHVILNPSYYYFAHFSRFIKKGAKRIAVCTTTDIIEATGFINPNGEKVLVVCNNSEQNLTYALHNIDKGSYITMAARSIQTVVF
jgi:glucosylceramidase